MKLQSIQVLRGLAALLVVLYHTQSLESLGIASNGLTEAPLISGMLTNGYAGVDLFFVISGFIMVFVTQHAGAGAKTAASFLFARITRIYPVWWAFAGAMTLYMLAAHGLSGQSPSWQKASQSIPFVPYLVDSFLLKPQSAFPVLNVGWTLVHEMYFYLVFTVFMVLPRKLLPVLLALWAATVLTGAFLGYALPHASTWISLAVHPMTLEFILGALAGLAVTRGWTWRSGVVTLAATLWLLAALCYQGEETVPTLLWTRVLWYGLPSAALVYGIASLEVNARMAWLVPAAAGILVCTALYQLYGLTGMSPEIARRGATILSVTVGGLAMLIVLWFGWLWGQAMPGKIRGMAPALHKILGAFSRLGDWSFSLYLCHIIVLSLLKRTFDTLGSIPVLAPVFQLGRPGPIDNMAFVAIGVTLCIATAAYAYRFFEKPSHDLFSRMRRGMFGRKVQATAAA